MGDELKPWQRRLFWLVILVVFGAVSVLFWPSLPPLVLAVIAPGWLVVVGIALREVIRG